MSKISKQVDQQQSDSDLSLQLSDASSLTSDSDLSDTQQQQQQQVKKKTPLKTKKKTVKKATKKSTAAAAKNKKKAKDNSQYCTCRRGYDGKEFMIECDGCQEWFHGACVGLKPNSVTDHYFCKSCLKAKKKPAPTALAMSAGKTLIPPPPPATTTTKKKSLIILPIAKPEPKPTPLPSPPPPSQPIIPVISKLSIQDDDDEDEDLDDICPVCDGDCTCGTGSTMTAPVIAAPPSPVIPEPPKIEVPKLVIKKTIPASKSKKSKIPKKSIVVKDDASNTIDLSDSVSDMSDSSSISSDEDDVVIERVGVNVKKKPVPKKKAAPAAAAKSNPTVRRGKSTTLLANIVRQKAPHYASKGRGKGSKNISLVASSIKMSSEEEDSDEEVVVDDLDDLLETMSPLSEHSSNESDNSLLESEEFFTDDDEENEEDVDIDSSSLVNSPYPDSSISYSSVHIDSGDDEDIEDAETKAIIADMTLNSDEEIDDDDSDLEEGMFVEDDEDDDDEMEGNGFSISYYSGNNNWSTDEDEEEEEFDYTTAFPSEDDMNNADIEDSDEDRPPNPLLPLLDSEGSLYDNIAAAFIQALAPGSGIQQQQNGDVSTEANTPVIHGEYQLSPFELAHALSTLSGDRQNQIEFLRRPSLPSSAVSAAQRNRGSQDFNTSEALRALSALVSDDLPLSLEPIHESEDFSDAQEMDTMETPASSPSPPPSHSLSISTDLVSQPPSAATSPTGDASILPNQLALSLSTDLKLQEQILDILKGSTVAAAAETSNSKLPNTTTFNNSSNTDDSTAKKLPAAVANDNTSTTTLPATSNTTSPNISIFSSNSSRQILPKPSGSGVGSSSSASSFFPISLTTAALEQQIQDAINESIENSKRKGLTGFLSENNNSVKKRRLSRSNSLTLGNNLQLMETTSFSTPASPAAIIDELEDMNIKIDGDNDEVKKENEDEEGMAVSMDDLVDTSQLYTRSMSRSPSPEPDDDNPYSRDLSRWQRIPIGAFRLMRSKNKLWLER